ncbi:MAG TPA: tRNA 2-thiouridine(34) synthase MnmA [Stellaceae bacterium]|jgi:tRNA-specific 2-thiouridylase|nr:tRNA 2-thiouridine(34) synthase MnmA [Stellaceae bacterium]
MRGPADLDLPGAPSGHRIVVAMSGGVDSSVTAALCVAAGFGVVGITLQLYDHGAATGRKGACCAGQDVRDAARVAERLGIPHYVLDYQARFRAAVIEDFADSYRRGETPIPCIRCNERIKFRDLLGMARDLGANALATGHYARRVAGPDGPELHRARDMARDQSYFLCRTTREELEFLRFPLGGLAKGETRELARELALPVADKPDSQDICFVPQGSYAALVTRLQPGAGEPGDIVDREGQVLGRHPGIAHFTVGQRKGLGIAGAEPLYVLRIEPTTHRVVVGPKTALGETRIPLADLNWLAAPLAAGGALRVAAKLRSAQPPVPATLHADAAGQGDTELVLDAPAGAVAPGQAAVLYDGERVLGGGWIRRPAADAA